MSGTRQYMDMTANVCITKMAAEKGRVDSQHHYYFLSPLLYLVLSCLSLCIMTDTISGLYFFKLSCRAMYIYGHENV